MSLVEVAGTLQASYATKAALAQVRRTLARVGSGVDLCVSALENVSYGLCATVPYRRGQFITEYAGQRLTTDECRSLASNTHTRSLQTLRTCIVGLTSDDDVAGHGGASLVNDTVDLAHSSVDNIVRAFEPNCRFVRLVVHTTEPVFRILGPDEIAIALVAVCDIKAGEELFASYGDDYWKNVL